MDVECLSYRTRKDVHEGNSPILIEGNDPVAIVICRHGDDLGFCIEGKVRLPELDGVLVYIQRIFKSFLGFGNERSSEIGGRIGQCRESCFDSLEALATSKLLLGDGGQAARFGSEGIA